MPMSTLIEHSDNYSKTPGSLWQYCRNTLALDDNTVVVDFDVANVTDSFKFKAKITGQTDANGTKNVEIMVPSKYLSNFWRSLDIPLIYCEFNLILTWSANCVIFSTSIANQDAIFSVTDTNLYVLGVILSAEDNAKLLEKLKSGFKRTINCNKYQTKATIQPQNKYLDYLIDPSFQGVNRFFVLSFENNAH